MKYANAVTVDINERGVFICCNTSLNIRPEYSRIATHGHQQQINGFRRALLSTLCINRRVSKRNGMHAPREPRSMHDGRPETGEHPPYWTQ
jgi:hypothetical protein